MDPLVITGHVGKSVDHLLGHLEPFGSADFLTDQIVNFTWTAHYDTHFGASGIVIP
jgi:hypothetical protein